MARPSRDSIDDTDRRILELLLRDGRRSHSEMARLLQMPETTVRNRVLRLVSHGYVQIVAVLNADRFGQVIEVVINVKCDPPLIDEVATAFAAREETRRVRRTVGMKDLVVDAGFLDQNQFLQYMDFAARIEGVRELECSHVLKIYKAQFITGHAWHELEPGSNGNGIPGSLLTVEEPARSQAD